MNSSGTATACENRCLNVADFGSSSKAKDSIMEASHRRTERFYLKLLFWSVVGIAILIAVCWGGRDIYARWQERRLIRRAAVALEHGDDATASLAARAVLQIKAKSAPAARIIAQIGEKGGNRAALDWRHRVLEVEPHSVDDELALARCALQFNEPAVAEQAISEIDEQGKHQAGYHAVAATLADMKKDDETALHEWEQAVQLAPEDGGYQLKLATLELRSGKPDRQGAGRAILNKLRDDPKQRGAATRALITDGIARHASNQELLRLAQDLQGYPEATTADRLIYLDFMHQIDAPEFTSYLTKFEADVVSKPVELGSLLEWMSRNNLNLVALDYIKSVPAELLTKWPVPLAIAELYDRLRDWRKLEQVTTNANWGQGEFIRHAYLSRALREQDKMAGAEHEWAAATKEASAQSASLMSLMHTTAEWKWEKEMVDLLWTLTRSQDKQKEAVEELYRYYEKASDTQGLYRVLVRWAELEPDNLNVQNNFVQVALLLDANADDARRIAVDLHNKAPSNPAYTTTYAYSLLTKGNSKEAAKVMSSLTPEELRDPSVSAYYGICLAAVHDEKAREFLAAGQKAPLLPEEKKLIDKAFASLDSWRRIR